MPYIKQEERVFVDDAIDKLKTVLQYRHSSGDLNYMITTIIHEWMSRNGASYNTYNAAIGVLECAKLELYRRKIAPYEDEKIIKNGDV